MILATKSGWLISCKVLRETKRAHIVKYIDDSRERRIPKGAKDRKLFDSVDSAEEWILEKIK